MAASVIQLVRSLGAPLPATPAIGATLRTFGQEGDVGAWLRLREVAFSRQRLGVRSWSVEDFELEVRRKPWWDPSRMWLVEAQEPASGLPYSGRLGEPTQLGDIVGSVILAQRGSSAAEPKGGKPAIHWLMVDPRWRRRGLGRWLLATAEQRARADGFSEIYLESHASWNAAMELYRAAGYREWQP